VHLISNKSAYPSIVFTYDVIATPRGIFICTLNQTTETDNDCRRDITSNPSNQMFSFLLWTSTYCELFE